MTGLLFILYQIAAGLAASVGSLYMAVFRFRELRERLGGGETGARGGGVWVHAASLGEFEAAWPIARACGWSDDPGRLLVSCTNATARRRLMERLPAGARARIAPLDFWPCVRRALARERPRLLLFVETEIWPAWILAAARQGIPLALVSARLSDSSFPRYRRLRGCLKPVLERFAVIGCRSEEDRRRWISIGAPEDRCFVWGNTKYDAVSVCRSRDRGRDHREGDRFLLVAGSMRPGEEGILDVVSAVSSPAIRLVVAPRHLDTIRRWEDACFRRGLDCRRSSLAGLDLQNASEEAGHALRRADSRLPSVLIVDQMGILNALYELADAAFVGGTWVLVGGHNLFEPARQGIPVFFGSSLSGVRDAAEVLIRSGGGIMVSDAAALAAEIQRIGIDPDECERIGRLARRAAESLAGGVERTVEGLRGAGLLEQAAR
jgi:3-deoxy-D-manno-octulosonic-acid transferase